MAGLGRGAVQSRPPVAQSAVCSGQPLVSFGRQCHGAVLQSESESESESETNSESDQRTPRPAGQRSE